VRRFFAITQHLRGRSRRLPAQRKTPPRASMARFPAPLRTENHGGLRSKAKLLKWARHPNLRKRPGRASRSPVGHRLYEDAGCMVGLQAAELPSVDETAITDTVTSPPKPKNSALVSSTGFRLVIMVLLDKLMHEKDGDDGKQTRRDDECLGR
jgi:hypothetical protein